MNVTDPIADLLTRIRNGQKAGHESVIVPASKVKIAITHLLKQEGFIKNYKCVRDDKQGVIRIALKYDDAGKGIIGSIARGSSPACRRYFGADKIPYVKGGFGIGILSTSRGIMTDRTARAEGVGGEYLCSVY
jgi:small subunit ribosomal protein S8